MWVKDLLFSEKSQQASDNAPKKWGLPKTLHHGVTQDSSPRTKRAPMLWKAISQNNSSIVAYLLYKGLYLTLDYPALHSSPRLQMQEISNWNSNYIFQYFPCYLWDQTSFCRATDSTLQGIQEVSVLAKTMTGGLNIWNLSGGPYWTWGPGQLTHKFT